jgi:hypothetical protein
MRYFRFGLPLRHVTKVVFITIRQFYEIQCHIYTLFASLQIEYNASESIDVSACLVTEEKSYYL